MKLNDTINTKLLELIKTEKTPFYLYDKAHISRNCQQLQSIAYPNKSIHFAMMANANSKFLRCVKKEGLYVFVNSINHLKKALKVGFSGREIVFAASAMDEKKMKKASESHCQVILDSLGQLENWKKISPKTSAGIRCNIGEFIEAKNTNAGYFIGKESRLGFEIKEIQSIKGDPAIEGLHTYVGTNVTDIDYFIECYRQIIKLAKWFPNLRYLDFGGGFGLGEETFVEFDMIQYGKQVTELMESISLDLGRDIELLLEPGRIIGACAGYFVSTAVDIKSRNNRQLIGVDASSVQFPRPLFYPDKAFHPAQVIHLNGSTQTTPLVKSTVFGCSTYSRDFLAKDVELPGVKEGDLIVLEHAGSYCASAHSDFLGFPKAKEYFV